jgi:hypothetical protein
MSNEKQTAVDKLYNEMYKIIEFYAGNEQLDKCMELLDKAKEMEKEQIEEAYKYARAHWSREDGNAERYYNETYGGNK